MIIYTKVKAMINEMMIENLIETSAVPKVNNILVCVTQQKNCERLINRAVSIGRGTATIHVIHVVLEENNFMNTSHESEALEYLFGVSKSVGASLSVIKASNITDAIAE